MTTTQYETPNGHHPDCLCGPCHARKLGMTPAEYKGWIRGGCGRTNADPTPIPDGPTAAEINNSRGYEPPTTPDPDMPAKSPEQVLAETEAFLREIGRKLEIADVTHALKRAAGIWLHRYTGDFGWLVDVKGRHGNLSDGQAKGVLNCWRADLLRQRSKPASAVPAAVLDVPEGHYAVVSATGNNDLDFYRVDRPTDGKWAGYTFVKRVIGGHPDTRIRGAEQRQALQRILDAGVDDAATLYGVEVGRCYVCNRHLTDKTSRELGIGPDCRSRQA